MPKLIDVYQVARLFGVSKNTIERWLAAGKLPKPTQQRFGCRLWDYERLESLLKRNPHREEELHGT
jgi:excisionase family DNA binding protein